MEGFLSKKGSINPLFKRRYFRLKDDNLLYYYLTEKIDEIPKGNISLLNCTKIHQQEGKILIETPGRIYILFPSSEKDLKDWMDAFSTRMYLILTGNVIKTETKNDNINNNINENENNNNNTKIYSGFILKRGKLNKSFKRRYMNLFSNGELKYYLNDKEGSNSVGSIKLTNAKSIFCGDDLSN